ncbi:hypothetical protein Q3G72_022137 [Acer saccharum]|nr:hypothetical protein Q3G72_022137 [Acer saccharum]
MAEEHRCQAPQLCANNCGIFGILATQNLCSKCYRDFQLKQQQSSSAKLTFNQSFIPSTSLPSPPPLHISLPDTLTVPEIDNKEETKHHHSLGDSVLSPDAISSLSSVYHIPKSVTLVVPHAGYDPVEPEEGNLPLPLSTFDQGLRLPLHPFVKKVLSGLEIAPFQLGPLGLQNIISLFVLWMEVAKVFPTLKDFVSFYQGNKSTSTLGQFYLKCNHTAGNPILPGKKPKGDCKMKWVIARYSWGRPVLMQQERLSIRTSFNYVGSLPRLLDTSNSFEEKIARVVSRKRKSKGKKDVMDPSWLVGVGFWRVPKKVNPTMKGFGNLELNSLDSIPGEKWVKRELFVSSVVGGVTSVGGPSSLVPPGGTSSKVVQSL